MDYARIYAEFIADRRSKENSLIGYTEKHHVVPRSQGGTDAASNLIRLTLEDHIRAHVLLGRIYGGTMWFALRQMVGQYTKRGIIPTRRERKLAAMGIKKAREFSQSLEGRSIGRDASIRQWADPEKKHNHLAAMRDPQVRARLSSLAVDRYKTPSNRAATSAAVSAACNAPAYLAMLSQKSTKIMADPEVRRRIQSSNIKAYTDPSLRARVGAAISAANLNPESRQRRSKAAKSTANDPAVVNAKRAAMKKLLAGKVAFCQVHGITNPGNGYCNIDKAAFAAWLAQQEAPR